MEDSMPGTGELRNRTETVKTWRSHRILDLFGIQLPIIQAPMAGVGTSAMAVAVAEAGGLGSLPCALLTLDQIRGETAAIRRLTAAPLNLNFFCHASLPVDVAQQGAWPRHLEPYYKELGLDPAAPVPGTELLPFASDHCEVVEEVKPEVVSFHFGLPSKDLVDRVKATGARVLSSATTVDEALWLEDHGCDAVIAQGLEAGGHRGMFLTEDLSTQVGTMALVPQLVDAVSIPVIAAGGIGDARGIAAAFALGASAVQLGTAYLFCPEANVTAVHKQALIAPHCDHTAVTNIFTGRPARAVVNRVVRELGPMSDQVPAFPHGGAALGLLRAKSGSLGLAADFTPLWAGQAARLGRELPAAELTCQLAEETLQELAKLGVSMRLGGDRGSAH
jgi:nitronate monooxygenase